MAETQKKAMQVFISHSASDKAWTDDFADALQAKGVEIWYDVKALRPGDRWQDRIQDALRESRVLCLVIGPQSIRSPWAFFELGAAVADRKVIIPVLTGDVKPVDLPPPLLHLQAVGERSPQEAAARVAEVVAAAA